MGTYALEELQHAYMLFYKIYFANNIYFRISDEIL